MSLESGWISELNLPEPRFRRRGKLLALNRSSKNCRFDNGKCNSWNVGGGASSFVSYSSCKRVSRYGEGGRGSEQGFPVWNWTAFGIQ